MSTISERAIPALALLLADARFPVGSHVSSNGLEPALRGGMHPGLTPLFMANRARTVALVEAGTAVASMRAVEGGVADVTARLRAVERSWAARTPSSALRATSRALGRGYTRLARKLWPELPAVSVLSTANTPFSRAVIVGAIAAHGETDAAMLVRLMIYDDAQTVATALLKLEPMDPVVCTGWVLAACQDAERYVEAVAAITSPDAIPAFGSPENEEWAEAHSHQTQRLFSA
jgi:urease accessory protein